MIGIVSKDQIKRLHKEVVQEEEVGDVASSSSPSMELYCSFNTNGIIIFIMNLISRPIPFLHSCQYGYIYNGYFFLFNSDQVSSERCLYLPSSILTEQLLTSW